MPTSSLYGVRDRKPGGLSLQQLGQDALNNQDPGQGSLPSSPWAALPQVNAPTAPQTVASVNPANIPEGFQFSGEFDAANRGLQQQESDAGLMRTNNLARIAEEYQIAQRKANDQNERSRRKLYEGLADKGALGSSASLDTVAQYDTDYNNYLNDLARQRAYQSSDVENQYAGILNNLGRQREGLVSRQQSAEQARLLEEARVQQEAERLRQEEEVRRQQIEQLVASQQAAMRQAVQQVAAASYTPGGGGGGYDIGGGYGGGGAPAAKPVAPQLPQQNPDMVYIPGFAPGVPSSAVDRWIMTNVDPNMSPSALRQVRKVLLDAGGNGVSRADLGWLINQYPNGQTSTNRAPGVITARNR